MSGPQMPAQSAAGAVAVGSDIEDDEAPAPVPWPRPTSFRVASSEGMQAAQFGELQDAFERRGWRAFEEPAAFEFMQTAQQSLASGPGFEVVEQVVPGGIQDGVGHPEHFVETLVRLQFHGWIMNQAEGKARHRTGPTGAATLAASKGSLRFGSGRRYPSPESPPPKPPAASAEVLTRDSKNEGDIFIELRQRA